jgi:hypothetical protein
MAAYKMAAVKVTPPNDFPLGLLRSHMVVIQLFLMLCDLQRVVRDLRPTLYMCRLFHIVLCCTYVCFTVAVNGDYFPKPL